MAKYSKYDESILCGYVHFLLILIIIAIALYGLNAIAENGEKHKAERIAAEQAQIAQEAKEAQVINDFREMHKKIAQNAQFKNGSK